MLVKVLGCSGGIGGKDLRTTSLLVDHDILIDAGTGVGDLSIDALARIDHLFLTHSHLDHICCLPFMVDTVGEMRGGQALVVHTSQATQDSLRQHIFNWSIWPDFTAIPNREHPFLRFEVMEAGDTLELNGRRITALPALHTVPAVGYQLDSGRASLVFSGDTATNDEFWKTLNAIPQLRYLLIETAFSDAERKLAELSRHLCPTLLAAGLKQLRSRPEMFITHLKPSQAEQTMREIHALLGDLQPQMLRPDHCFNL
jgi:ribonuclease BN (tRNA processing enzyme)